MDDKAGDNRGPRRAAALVVTAAVTVVATSCSVSVYTSYPVGSVGSATYEHDLAFVECMRHHGEPHFPAPRPGSSVGLLIWQNGEKPSGAQQRAINACEPLLRSGSDQPAQQQHSP